MPQKSYAVLVLLILATAVSACAHLGGGGDATAELRVENNLIPPTTLSVYALPDTGTRQLVGIVRPGATTDLSFSPRAAASYQFVAETTEGRDIVSPPINIRAGDTAEWDLDANIVLPQ
ncbi:MAG: hypothetical protein WD737_14855 [Gemmatimonadota bacterium]